MKRFTPLQLREYREGDAIKMWNLRHDDIGFNDMAMTDRTACGCHSYTLLKDKKVVGICGCMAQWPGVGVMWSSFSHEVKGHGLQLTRLSRMVVRESLVIQDLRKIYALVNSDDLRNVRWARLVGFTIEYVMKNAGPKGQDVWGMAFSRR